MTFLVMTSFFLIIGLLSVSICLSIALLLNNNQQASGILDISPPNSNSSWHFAAIGDWGHDQESLDTLKNINASTRNLAFILGLGDYFYWEGQNQTDLTERWYKEMIEPLNLDFKLALGDHDKRHSDIYKELFKFDNWTSSFAHKGIQFVGLNTEESLTNGSTQYNLLLSELNKAQDDPKIKWIVIFMHKPIYGSRAPLEPDLSIVSTLHPLFDKYSKVALVLNGHNHIYQRTYPIMFNHLNPYFPFVMSNNTHDYSDPCGQIYTTVGTGGAELIANEDSPPYIYATEVDYGFLDVEVKDEYTLEGKFYPTYESGNYTDHFTIRKSNSHAGQVDCNARHDELAAKNSEIPNMNSFVVLIDKLKGGQMKDIVWVDIGNNITKATYIDSSNYNHTEKQTFHFPYENLNTGDEFKACIMQIEDFNVTCKEGIFDDSTAETTIRFTIS